MTFWNCTGVIIVLQMGGSDQWGNIVNGIELARRTDQAGLFGLTTNLLTTSSGAKMGKTAQGAVWLNADMLPVYDYWQFGATLKTGTLPVFAAVHRIAGNRNARLAKLEGAELNDAKKVLATEATAMCHGRDAAQKAEATARETFEGGGKSADLPSVAVGAGQLNTGIGLLEAFVLAGLAGSNGEARRLVQGGGARINDVAQNEIARTLTQSDIKDGVIKLSAGKKRHVLLVPEG